VFAPQRLRRLRYLLSRHAQRSAALSGAARHAAGKEEELHY